MRPSSQQAEKPRRSTTKPICSGSSLRIILLVGQARLPLLPRRLNCWMISSFTFKRGTTFALLMQATDDASGDPHDLTGATIASQLRDSLGNLVVELTCEPQPQLPGSVLLTSPSATDEWQLGLLSCDIKVTNPDGSIWDTETVVIHVVQQVTQ